MSFTDPTGLIRAPMPWERDPCSRVSGCLNLNGGGFGSGTARVQGVRGYLNVWVSWVLLPTGYDRDVIGFEWIPRLNISFGLERTFTEVAVPAEKQPGDRPVAPAPRGPGDVAESFESGNGHHYRIRGWICSRELNPHCNEEWAKRVFEHVNRNDIPYNSGNDLETGTHELILNNPIDHSHDEEGLWSENVALEEHWLYPGRVKHRVFFEDGNLYYDVQGTGTGGWDPLVNTVGSWTFRPGVKSVVQKFGDPPRIRYGEFDPFYP